MTPEDRKTQAKLAIRKRWHPTDPETERLKREHAENMLAREVARKLPLLTEEQRRRIAAQLVPSIEDGEAA